MNGLGAEDAVGIGRAGAKCRARYRADGRTRQRPGNSGRPRPRPPRLLRGPQARRAGRFRPGRQQVERAAARDRHGHRRVVVALGLVEAGPGPGQQQPECGLPRGRMQVRPEQLQRVPPPAQSVRGSLQDPHRDGRRPGTEILPAVQQVMEQDPVALGV